MGGGWLWLALTGDAAGSLFGRAPVEVPPLTPRAALERRTAFQEKLRTTGWQEHDGHLVPPPLADASSSRSQATQSRFEAHRATLFLNFWGVEMLHTGSNAALDESTCVPFDMPWPGFDGDQAQALAIIEIVEQHLAPYGVRVVYDERPPAHLPYAMVLFGGTPDLIGAGATVLGTSCSSDCGDRWWRDTTLVFTGNAHAADASSVATTALHEAAHAFGLTHTDEPTQIMYPFVSRGATWGTECAAFDTRTGSIICRENHLELCEDGQNSDAELFAMFGPNSPDTAPPRVEILAPADGTEFAPGESFNVEALVEDNFAGFGWKLSIPELAWETVAFHGERQWPLTGLPVGAHTLRVDAIDHDRNVGSDEIRIYVGVPVGTPSPLDPVVDEDEAPGCQCRASTNSGYPSATLLAGVLWFLRRRRRPEREFSR